MGVGQTAEDLGRQFRQMRRQPRNLSIAFHRRQETNSFDCSSQLLSLLPNQSCRWTARWPYRKADHRYSSPK